MKFKDYINEGRIGFYHLSIDEIVSKLKEKNEFNKNSLPKLKTQMSLAKKSNDKEKYEKIKKIIDLLQEKNVDSLSMENLKIKYGYNLTKLPVRLKNVIKRLKNNSMDLNNSFRTIYYKSDETMRKNAEELFSNYKLKNDITLYRKLLLSKNNIKAIENINDQLFNNKFKDKGFLSCTVDKNSFDKITSHWIYDYTILYNFTINCKKGQDVFFLDSLPNEYDYEKEFLINKNVNFLVTKINKIKDTRKLTIYDIEMKII